MHAKYQAGGTIKCQLSSRTDAEDAEKNFKMDMDERI